MSTEYDAIEQWQYAAGTHWNSRRTGCTEDDHDTLDSFCGACGVQLNDAGECDECASGSHDDGGMPFCPCCGRAARGKGPGQ